MTSQKPWKKRPWTVDDLRTAVIVAITILSLVGMVYYGVHYYETDPALNQGRFGVTGSSEHVALAFDGNENTAWVGRDGAYTQFNYAVVDFSQPTTTSNLLIVLGGSGAPINYMVSLQSSNDAATWTDVIGQVETGYFTEKTKFDFPFLPQSARYYKIGFKPFGAAFQQHQVYEIILK